MITKLFDKMFCKIGLHQWKDEAKFYPSIEAKIVKRVESKSKCIICGKESEIHIYDDKKERPWAYKK